MFARGIFQKGRHAFWLQLPHSSQLLPPYPCACDGCQFAHASSCVLAAGEENILLADGGCVGIGDDGISTLGLTGDWLTLSGVAVGPKTFLDTSK